MQSLTAQVLVDIINEEMSMPADAVWIRNQARQIPGDNGLYIIVGMTAAWPIANETYMKQETVDAVVEQHQISEVQQRENIQIDIVSRSNDALTRCWEVVAAMQSFYAQQQMEKNNFKIFRIPSQFIDLSSAEGGSQLNRYSITIATVIWYRKDKLLNSPLGDYYTDFKTRADDEQTIGTDTPVFEFEIDNGSIIP